MDFDGNFDGLFNFVLHFFCASSCVSKAIGRCLLALSERNWDTASGSVDMPKISAYNRKPMEIGFRFFPIIVGIIVKYEILRHGQAHIGSLTQSKKVVGIVRFCTISRRILLQCRR